MNKIEKYDLSINYFSKLEWEKVRKPKHACRMQVASVNEYLILIQSFTWNKRRWVILSLYETPFLASNWSNQGYMINNDVELCTQIWHDYNKTACYTSAT